MFNVISPYKINLWVNMIQSDQKQKSTWNSNALQPPPPFIIFLTEHLSQIKLSCTKIDLTKCQNQYADNFASSVYLYSALIKSSFFFFDFLLSIDRFFFCISNLIFLGLRVKQDLSVWHKWKFPSAVTCTFRFEW